MCRVIEFSIDPETGDFLPIQSDGFKAIDAAKVEAILVELMGKPTSKTVKAEYHKPKVVVRAKQG